MTGDRSVTVALETVTPLFMAGADPRGEPELRPPAFRGALRYWLRAALGGALGGDVVAVRKAEAAVFGSTDEWAGGAGAVTVRIRHDGLPQAHWYRRDRAVFVRKDGRELRQPTGRDYLYWSMAESGSIERDNQVLAKQYYPQGTSFSLELALRLGTRAGAAVLDDAVAALWLLLHLGGVGSRARRTAGSLGPRNQIEREGLCFGMTGEDPAALANQLRVGLRRIRESFAARGQADFHSPADFDVLHPAVCTVWVLGVWPSPGAAVEEIGAVLRDFRTYREPDHRNVARWLVGVPIPTVERAAFGLPIPYRYEKGPSASVQAGTTDVDLDRRASPLWLTVNRTSAGAGVGIGTLFRSHFLPATASLYPIRNRRRVGPPVPPPQGYGLIERWVQQAFPAAREVRYG